MWMLLVKLARYPLWKSLANALGAEIESEGPGIQSFREEKMSPDKNTPRLLGAAFLLQAVASAVSGLFLLQPLIVSGSFT